jgi:integrase
MWLPTVEFESPDRQTAMRRDLSLSSTITSYCRLIAAIRHRTRWAPIFQSWPPSVPHLADRPMSTYSYKTAFNTARETAKIACRFYDSRHSFITRLAENHTISEETIRQLAGHVSPRMLARYVHIRVQARRDAIATLEPCGLAEKAKIERDSPQKSPQSADFDEPVLN